MPESENRQIKSLKEWEQCRDKAESSVSQLEVGIVGVEAEIEMKCGAPPAKEPSSLTGSLGMYPYDLVRSKTWKDRFIRITRGEYQSLVDRLVVSDETKLEGDWIVGNGCAPHVCSIEEAAIAINTKTVEVFAVMMNNGNEFSKFGFNSWQDAPPPLKKWWNDNK